MIDYFPDDQYAKLLKKTQEINRPDICYRHFKPVDLLFITSDGALQDLDYAAYPIFEEIGISKDEFIRWSKYMALDRNSFEYLKVYREAICNLMAWQWRFSRLLQKPNGVVSHNAVMHYYLLELERLDKEIGIGFQAGYV